MQNQLYAEMSRWEYVTRRRWRRRLLQTAKKFLNRGMKILDDGFGLANICQNLQLFCYLRSQLQNFILFIPRNIFFLVFRLQWEKCQFLSWRSKKLPFSGWKIFLKLIFFSDEREKENEGRMVKWDLLRWHFKIWQFLNEHKLGTPGTVNYNKRGGFMVLFNEDFAVYIPYCCRACSYPPSFFAFIMFYITSWKL